MQRGSFDERAIIDGEDFEDEDRFQDYYGIVVESRQDLHHPQPTSSSMAYHDELDRSTAISKR